MPASHLLSSFNADSAIVLGSGLGSFCDRLSISARIPYCDAGLPESSVQGHAGEIILASLGGTRLAVFSGRVHLYEGRDPADTVASVRLAASSGIKRIILTNAAGSLHPDFPPGHWMMLTDHLNLTGRSPLTGSPHFIDMSAVYCPSWRATFATTAAAIGMPLHQGVYAGLCGPQYETPAEIRMLRTLGADAVGMSTVLEAIAARAAGLQIAAFSCLTNWAAGLAGPLSHSEVIDTGKRAAHNFSNLLEAVLRSN